MALRLATGTVAVTPATGTLSSESELVVTETQPGKLAGRRPGARLAHHDCMGPHTGTPAELRRLTLSHGSGARSRRRTGGPGQRFK